MSIQKESYYKIAEENGWEGETWYHYFLAEPGVKEALERVLCLDGHDFGELETIDLSDEEATVLANIDEGYMQPHWFGELDVEKLSTAVDSGDLYKGKIREYAEDLFEMVRTDGQEATK